MDEFAFDSWGNLYQDFDTAWQVQQPVDDDIPHNVGIYSNAVYADDEVGFRGEYGYETDPQTGLVLAGHRYYSPFTGKWMNRDPTGYDGGMNLYEYAGDDPVNEIDTSGDDGEAAGQFGVGNLNLMDYIGNMVDNSSLSYWEDGLIHNPVTHALKVVGSWVFMDPVDSPGPEIELGGALAERAAPAAASAYAATSKSIGVVATKSYEVYQSVSANAVDYVGMTTSFARRALQQLARSGRRISQIPGLRGLTYDEARGVEQALIEYHGLGKAGGTLLNKINSIARLNPKYGACLRMGVTILHNAHYPGF
jgi:RHS repeat-associated protein